MTLKEARAAGEMFYTGKVCVKHPELNGQRRASNGNCHACIRERMAKVSRKTKTKRKREWRQAVKAGHVPRKYRRAGEIGDRT